MKFCLLMLIFFGVTQVNANTNILQMAGCFDVTFEFKETQTSLGHTASSPYFASAKELVIVDKNTPEEIHLQHILISKHGVIKHWRQEWYLTEKINTAMDHVLPNHWEIKSYPKEKDLWLQYVGNTDDAPRYSCAAKWIDGTWKCDAWAPLPRREYTKRNDYNMMMRGNEVIVTNSGWVHRQKNQKIYASETGSFKQVGLEEGVNQYKKVSTEDCDSARNWWLERKTYWNVVQNMWRQVFSHHNPLHIDVLLGEIPLSTRLDDVVEKNRDATTSIESLNAVKKLSHDIIHEYML